MQLEAESRRVRPVPVSEVPGPAGPPGEPAAPAAVLPTAAAPAPRGDVGAVRALVAWAADHAVVAAAGRRTADLRVDDRRLGRVRVRLTVDGARVRVALAAAPAASAALRAEEESLAEELDRRGLRLAAFDAG